MNNSSFDPTDLKYQANPAFAPDKEKLWRHPAEHDGWVHAHNALRGEFQLIQECLEAIGKQASSGDPSSVTLSDWQVKALQKVFEAHYHFVHSHHHNEDDIVTPAVLKRFKYPEKLTDDHDGLVQTLASLKKSFGALKAGDDATESTTALLKEWKAYRSDIEEHLKEEEDIGLPLVRAYFKPKEWVQIVKKIIAKESKMVTGSFIYYMGAERMRSEFMKEEGIPFFVWYIVFGPALKLYEKRVIELADGLKTRVEPVPRRKGLLGC